MTLPLRERLTMMFMPAPLYYGPRIADETQWGEYELSVLGDLMAPGGTAIDVGANQGVFAFAFSKLASKVEAFEPNADYAAFARRMLGRRARVHEIALSNEGGQGEFVVPLAENGVVLHLGGSLHGAVPPSGRALRFSVAVRTLDSFAFKDVRIIKVDVEGSEMAVLQGASATIARDRPPLVVELLTGAHADPIAVTEAICTTYGYTAWLVTKELQKVAAIPAIRALGTNTTWGSPIRNRNVLFVKQA